MTFLENRQPPLNGNDADHCWMQQALRLALYARAHDEVPVGAIVVHKQKIIGEGWNQSINQHDPTAHAEMIALRQAGKQLQNYRLLDTTLYVTLEPCAMCASAILHARIKRVVFATWDPQVGAVRSQFSLFNNANFNHQVQWTEGVLHQECSRLLKDFFREKRQPN